MARKLSHKKAFRAKPGFSRQDVKTRVMQVLKHQKQEPIGIHALEVKVQLKHDERREFYDLLEQMQKSGELWRRRNSVVLSKNQGLIQAQIVTLNEKFGFARPFVEGELPADKAQDIFLPGRFMLGAMPGDTVMLRVEPKKGKAEEGENREGAVVQILKENDAPFTGVVVRQPDGYYLRPDRLARFLLEIEKGQLHGAKDGDKVLVKITHRVSP